MTCETAENLIAARIDGELSSDDAVALDAHLAECAACGAAAEAMQVQDAALVRAFAPARRAADDIAERVETSLAVANERRWRRARLMLWTSGIAAAVLIGAFAAMLSRYRIPHAPAPVAQIPHPIPLAQLELATGEVFTCPKSASPDGWRPAVAGAAVAQGDRVRTSPRACAELRLADGSQVRLSPDSLARFENDRCVELQQGQLWSAVPQQSKPLLVMAPQPAVSAVTPPGSRVDFAAPAGGTAVLTALHGPPATITDRAGCETRVEPGSAVKCKDGVVHEQRQEDVLLATRWINDLLVRKGRDDPELQARVQELLARVNQENKSRVATTGATRPTTTPTPGPTEKLIRAQGGQWSESLACLARCPEPQVDRASRLTAARLLADLALPETIDDLIALLADPDGEVRFYAATALRRLTGQTLGGSPEQCAKDGAAEIKQTHQAWVAWWNQNKPLEP
jgi:hypothetical protein